MNHINLLEWIIIAVILLLAFSGFRKGFVKKLASIASLVLSVVLVSACLPYITDILRSSTPVYTYIEGQCGNLIDGLVEESLQSSGRTGTSLSQANEGQSLTRIDQTELIENLPFPEALKDLLLDYNNEEGYRGLNVSGFQEYLASFIATCILNIIAFLLTVLIVQLVLWAVISALNIVSYIPVLRTVNRIAGLLLGLLEACFLLWVFFLVLSMLSGTPAGLYLMNQVEQSELLSLLYESNPFLPAVLHAETIFRV